MVLPNGAHVDVIDIDPNPDFDPEEPSYGSVMINVKPSPSDWMNINGISYTNDEIRLLGTSAL